MIKAGIVEGTSIQAGELIRLLINHPDVDLKWVYSLEAVGRRIDDVHAGLTGDTDLEFTDEIPEAPIDVLFLCCRPGGSRKFLATHTIAEGVHIIDLSPDFRGGGDAYGFLYGLPEVNRKYIVHGQHVCLPGAFATASLLALLPLARHLLLNDDICIYAAGGHLASFLTSGLVMLPENLMVSPSGFDQAETAEIVEILRHMQLSFRSQVTLLPMLGSFHRGVIAAVCTENRVSVEELERLYADYYDDHNFTFISHTMPDLKSVENTNKCVLHISKQGDRLLVVSVIDDLLKGAAGQAVHNMNLLFGLDERTGLRLKASAY